MDNVDGDTVDGFGEEWERFSHSEPSHGELTRVFNQYFSEFPWDALPPNATGADFGCGTGRWARYVAPRVGKLYCIDASRRALLVAQRNLAGEASCEFIEASVANVPLGPQTLDFGYSLGVLHHIPDTLAGLRHCVSKLRPGAPFLLYLYYALDNRSAPFRWIWRTSDLVRRGVSRLPHGPRHIVADALAISVYLPLSRTAAVLERAGVAVEAIPLSFYRDKSLYMMRNDALDRFGTRLEKRFSRVQITAMMEQAGLTQVRFRSEAPFWCAVGRKV